MAVQMDMSIRNGSKEIAAAINTSAPALSHSFQPTCQSGVWTSGDGTLSVVTLITGNFVNPVTLTCPSGYRRMACYIMTGENKKADVNNGIQPVGTNSCRFTGGWAGWTSSSGSMDCFQ